MGYGAPAKGNTCSIIAVFARISWISRWTGVPHKQGMLLPGVRIPIRAPEAIFQEKPDYVLILPWT